jgi:hypothetical protein
MKSVCLLSTSSLLLTGLLLAGCQNGEYASPPPPAEKAKAPACPPLNTITTNAQDAMPASLSGKMLEVPNVDSAMVPAIFMIGNNLFETAFTAAQGGGANVGEHMRYTRVPRADLTCPGQWATHLPKRPTGPNAQSCLECHSRPNDGAGPNAGNAQRDPLHSHDVSKIIQRNTPHLFGGGALQLLAEEMTVELNGLREKAEKDACASKKVVDQSLTAKGVDFGVLKVDCQSGIRQRDYSGVKGVSQDLVVRPFQWKKTVGKVRDFVLDATRNEIGMQGVELDQVKGNDSDGDGVVNELTVGQVTALTVYMALQPRPTTRTELTDRKILDDESVQERLGMQPVTDGEREAIKNGAKAFRDAQCDQCHKPELTLRSTQFKEPNGEFGAVSFDLATYSPDNSVTEGEKLNGNTLGAFADKDANGQTIVRLYGDLKRHDLGEGIAEAIDEPIDDAGNGVGRSTFGTKELWGVGCTGPWLHDGRATTLTEAILYHGGDASASREAFKALDAASRKALFAFLYDQVLYLHEFGESEVNDRGVCGSAEDEPETLPRIL